MLVANIGAQVPALASPAVSAVLPLVIYLVGRTQPERAEWNRLAHGNKAIQEVPIRVR